MSSLISYPLTKSQYSLLLISHRPWIPIQHGLAVNLQVTWSGEPIMLEGDCFLQMGHFCKLSGHWWGGWDAGDSQYLGSCPPRNKRGQETILSR